MKIISMNIDIFRGCDEVVEWWVECPQNAWLRDAARGWGWVVGGVSADVVAERACDGVVGGLYANLMAARWWAEW